MFTIFDEKAQAFARATVASHRAFERGQLDEASVRDMQRDALRRTVRYCRDGSPFYAEHLAGWTDARIDALELDDVAELPFTTKDDLREHLYDMLSRPIHDAWVLYETTGTTGAATPCPRDNFDTIVNNTAMTVCYDSVFSAHRAGHVVAVMGPSEMHSTGDAFGEVCRNLGHTVVKLWPHSPVIGFGRALEVMRETGVTCVFCTPGMAISLVKQARKRGLCARDDFAVETFMLTGELASPALLQNLGDIWGARAYNCLYASQEASVLAAVRDDGLLRTIPLNNYYEVIDPLTLGPAAPSEDGTIEGELVITHLYQGCKPLVRYRTGDLVRCRPPARAAAYPSPTIEPIGRARDRVTLNDRGLSAYDLEDAVISSLPRCLDYQIILERHDGEDRVVIEAEFDVDARAEDLLVAERRLGDRLGAYVTIRSRELGFLTSTGAMVGWKAARMDDRRSPDGDPERQAAVAIASARDARDD